MKKDFNSSDSSLGAILGLCIPIALAFLAVIIATIAGANTEGSVFLVIVNIITELSFLLAVFLICRKYQSDFSLATTASTKPKTKFVGLAVLLGVVCLFLLNPIISLWESLLSSIGYQISSELSFGLNNAGLIIFAILSVALLPAVCEEFLFRGTVLNGLRSFGARACILYSALIFGLMHQNLQQLPYTFILGIVSGILLFYTRSIWPSVIFHFTNNALVILLMAFPNIADAVFAWWLATENLNLALLWQIIIALLCVVLACLIIYFVIKSLKQNFDSTQPLAEENVGSIWHSKYLIIPICVGVMFLLISTIPKFGVI